MTCLLFICETKSTRTIDDDDYDDDDDSIVSIGRIETSSSSFFYRNEKVPLLQSHATGKCDAHKTWWVNARRKVWDEIMGEILQTHLRISCHVSKSENKFLKRF